MKKRYTHYLLPCIGSMIVLLFLSTAGLAQRIGNDAFLKGQYLEVGVSGAGSFGTQNTAPSGYHANSGRLGFVADPAKDGWTTGTPAYNGDYFVPGSPEEGWGITVNGTNYNNFLLMSSQQIPGSITSYSNTGGELSATWSGGVAGLAITQRTFFPTNALYFVMQVTIKNTTGTIIPNVYYMRNVDPDNEANWTGNFSTRNSIIYQPSTSACQEALVEAIGTRYGQYLGLGTKDSRARVTYGGFSNRSARNVWQGSGLSQSGTQAGDIAISIGYNLGNIAPGQEVTLSYAYILDRVQLNVALEATADPYFFANGSDVTATGARTICSPGTVNLEVKNVTGYTWTWSPSSGLNTTTGTTVTANVTETKTYTVTGTPTSTPSGCGSGTGVITKNITVTVASPLTPEIQGLATEYCTSDAPVTLKTNLSGGTFSGTGMSGNVFTPGSVPVNVPHIITYRYTDPVTNCEFTTSETVTVKSTPSAVLTGDGTICSGATAQLSVALTGEGPWTVRYSDGTTPLTVTANASPFIIPVSPGSNTTYSLLAVSNAGCAGTVSGSATITVNQKPVLAIPSLSPAESEAGKCGATVEFEATATGVPSPAVTYKIGETTISSPYFFPVGTTIVTATATNDCGTATATFTVTVTDKQSPVLSGIPSNLVMGTDADNCGAVVTWTPPTASDNCAGVELTSSHAPGTVFPIGKTTVTYTATDAADNTTTASFTVTVRDDEKPTVITHNITVQLNENGVATISASQINKGSFDNCGIKSMALSVTTFGCANVGDNTVTLTVVDNNGNEASANAIVTVEDNIKPTAVAQNITVQLDASGNVTITPEQVNLNSTDNCGIKSLALSKTDFSCSDIGANTVVLTVTDNNGNEASANAVVTVEDKIKPTVIAKNLTVQLDANGVATISVDQINNGSFDNCAIESMTLNATSFGCANVGPNTVTLTVKDVNGNEASATAVVTVVDKIKPTVKTQNITVRLDATGSATITADQINNGSTDNCGIRSIALDKSSFGCSDVGTNTVTLTVTDLSGNVSSATAVVTVKDEVKPVAVVKNVTVTLKGGSATVTALDLDAGSYDACGIASMSISQSSFDCDELGDHTVTFTLTDNNGNESETTAVVTVIGVKPVPAITVSRTDKTYTGSGTENTVFLGYGAQSLTLTASNATSASGATTYAWYPATALSSTTSANPEFGPTAAGTYIYTVTAVNEFGCSATSTVTLTVVDPRCASGKSGKLDKILVCHKGQVICIDASAVQAHLSHGCTIGECNQPVATTSKNNKIEGLTTSFTSYPTPFFDKTTLTFTLDKDEDYVLEVFDMRGVLVAKVANGKADADKRYEFELAGAGLAEGMYIARLTTPSKVHSLKTILKR